MNRSTKFKFYWQEMDIAGVEIKLKKSVGSRGTGIKNHLVCPECEGSLSQRYICDNCGNKTTIGEIDKRKAEVGEQTVVFRKEEKEEYVAQDIGDKFEVVDQVNGNDLLQGGYINRVDSEKLYEITNNDDSISSFIGDLREYIKEEEVALICRFDYYGVKKGILFVTKDNEGKEKLDVAMLRDHRNIRSTKQEVETGEHLEVRKKLDELSEDHTADKEREYYRKKAKGEEIEIEVAENDEEAQFGKLSQKVRA